MHDDPENEWILKLFVGKTIPLILTTEGGHSPPHPPETEISCTCRSTIANQSKQRIKFQKVPVDLIASTPEVVRKQPENFHYPPPPPPIEKITEACSMSQLKHS